MVKKLSCRLSRTVWSLNRKFSWGDVEDAQVQLLGRGKRGDVPVPVRDLSAFRRHQAEDGLEQGAFPAPLWPMTLTISPTATEREMSKRTLFLA